ncbi:hypothetical protein D3C76_1480850 [compost metagenome]
MKPVTWRSMDVGRKGVNSSVGAVFAQATLSVLSICRGGGNAIGKSGAGWFNAFCNFFQIEWILDCS